VEKLSRDGLTSARFNGEMLLLPRLGVLVVRVLFVEVRFVLVVVKGKVKKIPSWERRIGCRRDVVVVVVVVTATIKPSCTGSSAQQSGNTHAAAAHQRRTTCID
jgi:hypothetical protein